MEFHDKYINDVNSTVLCILKHISGLIKKIKKPLIIEMEIA